MVCDDEGCPFYDQVGAIDWACAGCASRTVHGYAPCNHKSDIDHSYPTEHGRVWICTACGHRGKWNEDWVYFGSAECKQCWAPKIVWVACSAECASKLEGDTCLRKK